MEFRQGRDPRIFAGNLSYYLDETDEEYLSAQIEKLEAELQ